MSQLYYFSWLGALIVTAVAFSYVHCHQDPYQVVDTAATPQAQTGQILKLICYIPAAMLLMIHNRYDSQLTAFLALLAALWFTVAYEKIAVRSSAARAVIFLVMFALLYYIAGGASFVFALLATIYECFVGRRSTISALFLTIAIGAYIVLRYIVALETEIIYMQILVIPLEYDPRLKL